MVRSRRGYFMKGVFMKKIFGILAIMQILSLCCFATVFAFNTEGYVTFSWATQSEGILPEKFEGNTQGNRGDLTQSLGEEDSIGTTGLEEKFTGLGYYPDGVVYKFNKTVEDGSEVKSWLVKNPNSNEPDISLHEITWGNDWCAEGVEVYAVNYNGTGEDKIIAIAYNKLAEPRLEQYNAKKGTNIELRTVEGSKVEYEYAFANNDNVYATNIWFPADFEYCEAIKLVDITEDLKIYGGGGQKSSDGYDLDAIYGYVINYDMECGNETAIAIATDSRVNNLKLGKSWQAIVMEVDVDDLKNGEVKFDIIAGQNYKIGEGSIFINVDGIVDVKYEFTKYELEILGEDTAKVGIYDNVNDMLKKGKLLGNGKLTEREEISEGKAYIRIHFDAQIPNYLYDITKIK